MKHTIESFFNRKDFDHPRPRSKKKAKEVVVREVGKYKCTWRESGSGSHSLKVSSGDGQSRFVSLGQITRAQAEDEFRTLISLVRAGGMDE